MLPRPLLSLLVCRILSTILHHGAARFPLEEDVATDHHRQTESEEDLDEQPSLNEQALAGELEMCEGVRMDIQAGLHSLCCICRNLPAKRVEVTSGMV